MGVQETFQKEVLKKLDELEMHMTRIYEIVHDDHKDISKVNIGQAGLTASVSELVDTTHRQTKRITEAVTTEVGKKVTDTIATEVPKKTKEGITDMFNKIKPKVIQVKVQKKRFNPFAFLWARKAGE